MKQLRLFDVSLVVEIFQLRSQISNCLRTARYADVFRRLGAAEQRLFNLTDALNFRPRRKKDAIPVGVYFRRRIRVFLFSRETRIPALHDCLYNACARV